MSTELPFAAGWFFATRPRADGLRSFGFVRCEKQVWKTRGSDMDAIQTWS